MQKIQSQRHELKSNVVFNLSAQKKFNLQNILNNELNINEIDYNYSNLVKSNISIVTVIQTTFYRN